MTTPRGPLTKREIEHYDAWLSRDAIAQEMLRLNAGLVEAIARAEKAEAEAQDAKNRAECFREGCHSLSAQVAALRAELQRQYDFFFFGHDSRIEKVLSLPVSDLGKAVEAVIQYAGEIDRSNPDNWEVLMPQEQNLREALAAALGKTL